jgi:hypothetical protein
VNSSLRAIRAAVVSSLAAAVLMPHVARAADQTVFGKELLVKNPGLSSARKIILQAIESATDNTIGGDPTFAGATLSISVDGGTSSAQVFTLAVALWRGDAVHAFKNRMRRA